MDKWGPCDVCGNSDANRLVNCRIEFGGHLHTLCRACDRYLSAPMRRSRWVTIEFPPRCPDTLTEADRVVMALRLGARP